MEVWPTAEVHMVVTSRVGGWQRRGKAGSTLRKILRCNREAQRVLSRGVT